MRSAWASIRVRGALSQDSTNKADFGIWRWLQLGKINPEIKINPKIASAKIIDFLENCKLEFAPTPPGPALGIVLKLQQFSFQYKSFVFEKFQN